MSAAMRACLALLLALAVPGTALAQQEPTANPAPAAEGAAPAAAADPAENTAPPVAETVAPDGEAPGTAAVQGPAPVPPVLVIPVWNERVPAVAAAAIRDAVAEQLRPLVRRRDVQMLGEEADLEAAQACADAPCLGTLVAGAGAISGVLVNLERRRPRDPVKVTLTVVDPVSGAPRAPAVEGEIPRDQLGTPAEALAALTAQLAPLMPEPPRTTTLLVAVNVDEATISIDEQEVGQSPLAPGAVNPGEHMVTVGRPGYLMQTRRIDVAQGQRTRMNFDLVPTAEQAAAEAIGGGGSLGSEAAATAAADDGSGEDDGSILGKWWLWAGVGGVVVLAVLIGVIAAASSGDGQQEAVTVPPIMP